MFKWITGNPIAAGLIGLAIIIFIVAGFSFLSRENRREEDNLRNQGAVTERSKTSGEVIKTVENAQRPITDAERNVVCDRFNRNREGCQ